MSGLTVIPAALGLASGSAEAEAPNTTVRLSLTSAEVQASGRSPSTSADGRYVAFVSAATNIVTDPRPYDDIFLRDRVAGTTVLVSATPGGATANNHSASPSVSPDGRFVAFDSLATDLVTGDTNGYRDVFVRDMRAGVTKLVSVATGGQQGTGDSSLASISAAGQRIAFKSTASNLDPADANGGSGDASSETGSRAPPRWSRSVPIRVAVTERRTIRTRSSSG